MANMLFANNANTTLSSSLSNSATSMSVTSATGFPSPTGVQYFYCTLADAATQTTIEIVKVTSVTGTTFAITRAQDGTSATAFAAGAVVSLRLVRASLNDFPKLDETNTFNADQAISGQLTSSAGLATTGTFTATAPSDGLVMDYATGFGRFSAFAGDGFQWYNAGIANTQLMQLSSSGAITTATWNGATVGTGYGGTGLTSFTANGVMYASSTSALTTGAGFTYDGTNLLFSNATYGGTNSIAMNLIGRTSTFNTHPLGYITIQTDPSTYAQGVITFGTTVSINSNDPVERMRIDSNGNLLVGTTSASLGAKLIVTPTNVDGVACQVNNNIYSTFYGYSSTGSSTFKVTGAGTIYAVNTTISSISDQRFKENIEDLNVGLDTIMALKPRKFDWKEGKGKNIKGDRGFIAQEFEQVFPDLIDEWMDKSPDGEEPYKSVRQDLMPVLVKAIQEQQEIIEQLKAKVGL